MNKLDKNTWKPFFLVLFSLLRSASEEKYKITKGFGFVQGWEKKLTTKSPLNTALIIVIIDQVSTIFSILICVCVSFWFATTKSSYRKGDLALYRKSTTTSTSIIKTILFSWVVWVFWLFSVHQFIRCENITTKKRYGKEREGEKVEWTSNYMTFINYLCLSNIRANFISTSARRERDSMCSG